MADAEWRENAECLKAIANDHQKSWKSSKFEILIFHIFVPIDYTSPFHKNDLGNFIH